MLGCSVGVAVSITAGAFVKNVYINGRLLADVMISNLEIILMQFIDKKRTV